MPTLFIVLASKVDLHASFPPFTGFTGRSERLSDKGGSDKNGFTPSLRASSFFHSQRLLPGEDASQFAGQGRRIRQISQNQSITSTITKLKPPAQWITSQHSDHFGQAHSAVTFHSFERDHESYAEGNGG